MASGDLPPTFKIDAEDLIRVRASTDENESTVVEWKGQAYAYKPGERPIHIFNVLGMSITRAIKLPDGSYDLLVREVQLYLDPKTDEVLKTWKNPWSDEDVTVVHVQNNPVQFKFPPSVAYTAQLLPGGFYTFNTTIPIGHTNPLNPSGKPDAPFAKYAGKQKLYSAIESFTFTVPASELLPSASGKSKSTPSLNLQWNRTSPLLPFMGTPDTDTSLTFIATGYKVASGWEGLHPTLKKVIDEKLVAYKEAPKERSGDGFGVSSWGWFMRPEVQEAYKEGTEFPLHDPPQ